MALFLYRIAILFFPQAPCVAKAPVFPNSICASYPAAAFLPFFARPFFKKADSSHSSAATRPCRSHRVNDTPARSALSLCSALRLPVPAFGFPPHFCPDTTTRPFPLHPAEPAPGAGTGGAPDAGGKTSRNFRCDPPPERVRGKQESSEDRLSPPPTWTVYGTPGIYNARPACFPRRAAFAVFRQAFLRKRATVPRLRTLRPAAMVHPLTDPRQFLQGPVHCLCRGSCTAWRKQKTATGKIRLPYAELELLPGFGPGTSCLPSMCSTD